MTEAIHSSAKETWQLVKFTNRANGQVLAAYTDSDSDQVFGGQLYDSTPEMEVKLPKNSGMLDKDPCNFILPIADTMTRRITDGILTNHLINVVVREIIRADGASANNLITFRGTCVGGAKNFSGNRDVLALSALTPKARLEQILLGIPCNHQCSNRLADGFCKVSMGIGSRTITKTLSTIDGKRVVLTGVPTGEQDRFFAKGYIEFDGITVMIQDWRNEIEGDANEFFMQERVPDEWLNQVVTVFSGCDKTIETCRSRYNNESQFLGLGYAIPAYHPQLEDGAARQ